MHEIIRGSIKQLSVAITATAPTAATIAANTCSTLVPCEGFVTGTVYVPAGSSLTSLTWYVSEGLDSTPYPPTGTAQSTSPLFYEAYDSNLTAPVAQVQTVAAGGAYAIPAAVLGGARALCPIGNTTGTIDIVLKA